VYSVQSDSNVDGGWLVAKPIERATAQRYEPPVFGGLEGIKVGVENAGKQEMVRYTYIDLRPCRRMKGNSYTSKVSCVTIAVAEQVISLYFILLNYKSSYFFFLAHL